MISTERNCAQRVAAPSVEPPPPPPPSSKEALSPKTEPDTSAETSCTSWVVDGSGFLSPTGPVLKEVMDMVDGVGPPFFPYKTLVLF